MANSQYYYNNSNNSLVAGKSFHYYDRESLLGYGDEVNGGSGSGVVTPSVLGQNNSGFLNVRTVVGARSDGGSKYGSCLSTQSSSRQTVHGRKLTGTAVTG